MRKIQRCKNYWKSIVVHWVVMLWTFVWAQFDELCDQLRCSTSFRILALRAQYRDFELQRSIASCATIEFLLFLHRWISLNSYYNWRHVSFIAYVMIINWTTDATIALAKFEIRRLSRRAFYRLEKSWQGPLLNRVARSNFFEKLLERPL